MCSGGAHTYEQRVSRLSTRWTPRCTVLEWQARSEHLPGPTHPTRHMQDPLVGEPQATPFAFFGPFTLHAVGRRAPRPMAALQQRSSIALAHVEMAPRQCAGRPVP